MVSSKQFNLFAVNNVTGIYLALAVFLLIALQLYFRLAIRFRIVDKPNERSSHTRPVIRGAGIIFILAIWCWYFIFGVQWYYFLAAATAIACVSFLDDVLTLPSAVRFFIHLISIVLLFFQLSLFDWPVILILPAIIICIGTLNAFNFMDGINGITGVYALTTFATFWYVNSNIYTFTNADLLLVSIVSVLIFLIFNFRKKARCFAGDVGSVTLAFVQVFLLLQLIYVTENFGWALMFLVFGIDSVITIVYRIRNRENIFKAHRTHLYQFLSNELKQNHLAVSIGYGITQLLVNVLIIQYFQSFTAMAFVFLLLYAAVYIFVRQQVIKAITIQGSMSK